MVQSHIVVYNYVTSSFTLLSYGFLFIKSFVNTTNQNKGLEDMNSLEITPETIELLKKFEKVNKFNERKQCDCCSSATYEEVRVRCETAINQMVSELIDGLTDRPQKDYVLTVFVKHLKKLGMEDSEKRKEACRYCEKIMDILNIESSDGVLAKWFYSFNLHKDV